MSDSAAGASSGAGAGRRRKSARARRPPTLFDVAKPAAQSLKKAKTEAMLQKERAQKQRDEAARKVVLPSPSDPSAFVRAAQKPQEPHFLPYHPSIDLDTGMKVTELPDWLKKQAPFDASAGREYVGRMVGKVTFRIRCSKAVSKKLAMPHSVKFQKLTTKPPFLMRTWDQDGEFNSKTDEHVPVSRLSDFLSSGQATCEEPSDGAALLQHIYALQSPQSSPWDRPMVRALSTHAADAEGLSITYYVYTSRLLFELIADPAINGMMKGLQPVAQVTPPATLQAQPVQFLSTRPSMASTPRATSTSTSTSTGGSSRAAGSGRGGGRGGGRGRARGRGGRGRSGPENGLGNGSGDGGEGEDAQAERARVCALAEREYDFSLAGILKAAESTGYGVVDDQPADLKVDLFEYQRSSCQWMLDHERDERGLNGYFWERREWADGGAPLWYFPLAGEFRLAEPPHITGGLLCEEMGLGKTMEVLSTILANPRSGCTGRKYDTNYDSELRLVSRATLIVVPVSLVGQWAEEIRKNVKPGALRVMTVTGMVECQVPLSKIQLSGRPAVLPGAAAGYQKRLCDAPYFAPGEDVERSKGWLCKGVAELRPEQAERLMHGRRDANGAPAASTAAAATDGDGDDDVQEVEMVRVEFKPDAWLVADNDVVLTTYELLRSRPTLFRKVNFHRCVLDECQEIKTATTNIAKMCQQVQATHRWMVSGTPLSSTIDDLHGELNFLQVWPFSLQNDGFWEKKIGDPFAAKDSGAMELLRALIRVVMMRHSKSQSYSDGRPLVKIPARTVEWRGVQFSASPESGRNANVSAPHARYVYKYLENLCASVCRSMERNVGGAAGGGENMGRREFTKLKSLLSLMQKASTHPALVNLSQLDTLKRSVQVMAPRAHPALHLAPQHAGFGRPMLSMGGGVISVAQMQANMRAALQGQADAIETLPAEEVLRRLTQQGSGNMGGLNRDVNRHWAVGGEAEMRLRDSLEAMPLADLQHRLEEEGLPVPRSWAVLQPKAYIDTGSTQIVFSPPEAPASAASACSAAAPAAGAAAGDKEEGVAVVGGVAASATTAGAAGGERYKGKGKGKRRPAWAGPPGPIDVRKLLKVSDTIRVGVNEEDNESTVESVEEKSATLVTKWVPGPVKAGRVYRFSVSSRRKPYVDLLVATDKAKKNTEVQMAGFSSIYKAMAGEPVPCPICMCSVVRPTVTKCAHLFCRECISRELQRVPALGMVHGAKCPICRRAMKGSEMMELQTLSEVEEALALDTASSSSSSTPEAANGSSSISGNTLENGNPIAAAAAVDSPAQASPLSAPSDTACDGGAGSASRNNKGKGKARAAAESGQSAGAGEGAGSTVATVTPAASSAAETGAEAGGAGVPAAGAGAGAAGVAAAAAACGGGGSGSVARFEVRGSGAAAGGGGGSCGDSGGCGSGNGDGGSPGSVSVSASSISALSPSPPPAGGSPGSSVVAVSPDGAREVGGGGGGGRSSSPLAVPGLVGASVGSGGGGARAGGAGEVEVEVGPSLVIPAFEFTPTATVAQLNTVPAAPIGVLRDHMVPSLEPTFLAHYRAATISRSSVKLDALVYDMEDTIRNDFTSKFVIFSQYQEVVMRAGMVLEGRGIRSTSIVGSRSRTERSSAVSSFTNDPAIKVILLTTGSAAAGLTLTAASTVYMLDPVWSAADEAQALNRAHRIGQTHTVRCVVFYMKDSVEERLLALRHSKGNFAQFLENADCVLSGSSEGAGSFVNMFALPELKKLFGMVGSRAAPSAAAGSLSDSESDSESEAEDDSNSDGEQNAGDARRAEWQRVLGAVGSGPEYDSDSDSAGSLLGSSSPLLQIFHDMVTARARPDSLVDLT